MDKSDAGAPTSDENESGQKYATQDRSEESSTDDSSASTPSHESTLADYPPPSPATGATPKKKPGRPPKQPPTAAELEQANLLQKQAKASTRPLTRCRKQATGKELIKIQDDHLPFKKSLNRGIDKVTCTLKSSFSPRRPKKHNKEKGEEREENK